MGDHNGAHVPSPKARQTQEPKSGNSQWMNSSLLSMPSETFQLICVDIGRSELKNLRLTSRICNSLFSPLLFDTICLKRNWIAFASWDPFLGIRPSENKFAHFTMTAVFYIVNTSLSGLMRGPLDTLLRFKSHKSLIFLIMNFGVSMVSWGNMV